MNTQNYQARIRVNATPEATTGAINNVPGWWATKFEGSADKAGDECTVRFSDDCFVTFQIKEANPGRKAVWHVSNCHLPWLKDKQEWNDTEVVWEIAPVGDNATEIAMTHVGLVPGIECYEGCEKGWNNYVTESLAMLINEGKGKPQA